MEGAEGEGDDVYDQTFIDVPAILDKYKAAAAVVDGKIYIYISNYPKSYNVLWFITFEKYFYTTLMIEVVFLKKFY